MYGNKMKPRRPTDTLDRYSLDEDFQSPRLPMAASGLPEDGLTPRAPMAPPQMNRLPDTLSQPTAPVNMPNIPVRPRPRDPVEQAREEAVYGGQMQRDLDIKPKRGFWDIMKTAGAGALQGMASGGLGGAIGGALAGGIGHAVDPMAGRGYRFDLFQRPRMEADIQRQMAYDKFGREQMRGQAELEQTMAQTEKTRAEAAALPGREELARRAAEARIGRDEAQTERYRQPAAPRYTPEEERRRAERHEAEIKRINAQTQRALRPPVGRGGGGEGGVKPERPEKPTSLPNGLLDMLNEAEVARQDAEDSWGQPELDPQTQKPIPGTNRGEKARRQYVQMLNRIKQYFPDHIDVMPGVGEQGQALPDWPYVQRRR